MEQEQLNDIKEKLLKLSRIELAYTRDWLMEHYSIFAMEHSVKAIVSIIYDVNAKYNDILNFINNIKDRSKLEIEESLFIEDEKNGSYYEWDAEEFINDLSIKEWGIFFNLLKDKYPKYKKMKELNYYEINNSFGKSGYASWEQAFYILMGIKENPIN